MAKNIESLYNMGNQALLIHQYEKAIAYYQDALKLNPQIPEILNNIGVAFKELHQWKKALEVLIKAIQHDPQFPDPYSNLGNVYHNMGNIVQADKAFAQSLKLAPTHPQKNYNYAIFLEQTGKLLQAKEFFEKAFQYDPSFSNAGSHLIYIKKQIFDWDGLSQLEDKVDQLNTQHLKFNAPVGELPLNHIARCMDVKKNYLISQNIAAQIKATLQTNQPLTIKSQRHNTNKNKIKVAYLSSDFHAHPTMHLLMGLFRCHNRQQFEIYCYSYGNQPNNSTQQHLKQYVDHFIDIYHQDDKQAAQHIFEQDIDIVVDLKGHTTGTRLGICAYRPAPIQITYLGFPGTTGADFIDYIIVDKTVCPEEDFAFYSEVPLHLPNCYQITDNQQPIADTAIKKSDFQLPEEQFIFASFNQPFKINAEILNIWANILHAVPNSCLWLSDPILPQARDNLLKAIKKIDINPSRIIFAKSVNKAQHLNRLSLVDLCLDTPIYNGHTTSTDALWAAVPIVTCCGKHFASRVCASLLKAIEVPELITNSLENYQSLAIKIATEQNFQQQLKTKIQQNKNTTALFNTEQQVIHLENLYLELVSSQ